MIIATSSAFYLVIVCAAAADAGQVRDPFEGAVPVVQFTFENDQDRDFDEQPDDWTRRKGKGFPAYVKTGIDREHGCRGSQSLQFGVNGGKVVTYSPPIPINSLHAYVLEGYIRTQHLKHDVALISLSLLNHKRERVQRFLTVPVSGTHRDWVRVRIGPVVPDRDVRFAVIGCHLTHNRKMDVRGKVWFDDLFLGQLPQLSLVSNFHTHFLRPNSDVEITSNVSGLDPERSYRLRLELQNSNEERVDEAVFELDHETLRAEARAIDVEAELNDDEQTPAPRASIVWQMPPQSNGYYQVNSILERDGEEIVRKQTTFAVLDLAAEQNSNAGNFGWTIEKDISTSSAVELADVAAEAGINWVKYPLWSSVYAEDAITRGNDVALLLESLAQRNITPIGLLNDPPPQMRQMFAEDWRGFSEIFTMPPSFWSPSLNPVIARYWSQVRYWQLGGDTDTSFVGLSRLAETLKTVKQELDRIGRDTHVGVHWDWHGEIPSRGTMSQAFLSLSHDPPLEGPDLAKALRKTEGASWPRWVLIKPLPRSKHLPIERGSDLVKRMVSAHRAGAEAIFAWNVYDPEHGLLHPNGSPTPLFLPWRTAALALQGSEALGSLDMPNRSPNSAFARNGMMTLFVWNDEETEETMYLGERPVVVDIWGRRTPMAEPDAEGRQTIRVGPVPQIIEGCSEAVARWRSALRFEVGRIKSEHGDHQEALLGRNTFPQGVNGTISLKVPKEWEIEPGSWQIQAAPGEEFRLPMVLTLPQNVSLGPQYLTIDMNLNADRPYKFRVEREFMVGLGDVLVEVFDRKLEDGRLEIEQVITNNTPDGEVLNFRCDLRIPGMRPRKQYVTKLKSGKDHKFYYLQDAESLRGTPVSIRAQQDGGRRILNYEWVIGRDWE